jgi:phenylacetate-CoA ligase
MTIPSIEKQSPEAIRDFQFEKVKALLAYLEIHSPFYKRILAEKGWKASSVKTWTDFFSLPLTSKNDIQQFNWEFLCVDKSKIVEYTATSGTLGKPVTIALTEKDIQRLAYNEAISFACADGDPSDLYQLMLTLDRQFMAGIAYYEGIRKLGAGLVRVGPGLPVMQWEIIERLRPTALVAVPSFIIKLIEFAQSQGIDVNKSSVKKAICIGESLRTSDFKLNTVAQKISDAWSIQLYSTYASTEMQTAFTECTHGKGGHLHPELLVVEVLDEEGNEARADEPGEVVITTLGVEGMPLLRYKTGDVCHLHREPCACGRTTDRLGPVVGRKQQMLKYKGTTLYPPAIFEILNQFESIKDYAVEAFTGQLGTDEIRLHVFVSGESEVILKKLQSTFQSRLRVIPDIVFTSQKEMETMQQVPAARKLRKFIDHR